MRFVNYVLYVEDQDAVAAIRPQHRAYVRELLERGERVLAGPFTDGSGGLFIYEADDADAANHLADADPYARSGAVKQQTISAWKLVYSNPDLLRSA